MLPTEIVRSFYEFWDAAESNDLLASPALE